MKTIRIATMLLQSAIAIGTIAQISPRPPSAVATSGEIAEPSHTPSFEVASIRAHKPDFRPTFSRIRFESDEFDAVNVLAQTLLIYAYDLRDPILKMRTGSIPGGPQWIQSAIYDVRAKISQSDLAELNKLNPKQQDARKRLIVQALLADRFHLKVHKVVKDAPAYKLVIAKSDPRNLKLKPDDTAPSNIRWIGWSHAEYTAAPLSALTDLLEGLVRCPVINDTGLMGKYDFRLDWARDPNTMPASEQTDTSEPELFTALQEDIGLKLVPTTAPLESIVIDSIDRPSEN